MKNIILIAPSRSGHNFTASMIRSWCPEDKFFKLEAIPPEDYARTFQQRRVDRNLDTVVVIQVRDYLNNAASWTKYCLNKGTAWQDDKVTAMFDVWLKITNEALNYTNHIGNKFVLYYDLFVQDQAYRKSFCSLLEGDYNEIFIDDVPNGGQGSSFDAMTFKQNGSKMDVTERWKWYLTDEGEYYHRHLKVKKNILEYYVDKFDLNTGQSKLVNEILK